MTPRFSEKVVDALLARLATDDKFRELFTTDVREALRQVGHETDPKSIGIVGQDPVLCCSPATLASKEQLSASRQQLRTQLLSQDPFMYFEAD